MGIIKQDVITGKYFTDCEDCGAAVDVSNPESIITIKCKKCKKCQQKIKADECEDFIGAKIVKVQRDSDDYINYIIVETTDGDKQKIVPNFNDEAWLEFEDAEEWEK